MPDSDRERIDPALQSPSLGSHELRIAKSVGEQRNPLISGDQGHGQLVGVGPSHGSELRTRPVDQTPHHHSQLPIQTVRTLVQLGGQRARGTTESDRHIPFVGSAANVSPAVR